MVEKFWNPLQKLNFKNIKRDSYGSKQFFKWFKNFDLNLAGKEQDKIAGIYYKLPNSIKLLLDKSKIYDLFNHTRKLLSDEEITEYTKIQPPYKRRKG